MSDGYPGLRTIYHMEQGEISIKDPSKLWYVMGMPGFQNFLTREVTKGDGPKKDKKHSWSWRPLSEGRNSASLGAASRTLKAGLEGLDIDMGIDGQIEI